MSVRQTQIENTLEDVVRILYATGVKPTLNDILELVSEFFSENPAGAPLALPLQFLREDVRSSAEVMNEIMSTLNVNVDVLYQVCQEQIDDVMALTTQLRSQMDRINARRKRVEGTIDDYLLSLFNSDGYYFSISDTFADLSLTDLNMTSAYVDATEGYVRLPTISTLSKRVEPSQLESPTISVQNTSGTNVAFKTIGPWSNAVDGLSNTVWSIEVEVDTPQEIIAYITLPISVGGAEISRVDYDPYGVTPAQFTPVVGVAGANNAVVEAPFGNRILTTMERFSIVNDPVPAKYLKMTVRKVEHDYVKTDTGSAKYCYIFGIKDLALTYQVYDNNATFVSRKLAIPSDLSREFVIDAVSITVDDDLPTDTSLEYFLAEDTGGTVLGDFVWKQIDPVDSTRPNATKTLRFNGARRITKSIVTSNPAPNDILAIPTDTTNSDLTKRNPSPVLIPGADMWRLAKFEDDTVLPKSMILEEGVNTTRVYDTTLSAAAVSDLDWWSTRIPTLTPSYSRIDIGNEFFYGGDVGESARSVYVETFVEVTNAADPILAEFRKSDLNSQTWDVRVFLNGRDIGFLPVGVHKLLIPYTFQEGRNHIAVLANIPAPTAAVPNPYIGTVDLMGTGDLFDQGVVRLATWNYVDLFDMKYNQNESPYTFTIYNDEIIARRKPTTNFRISYSSNTDQGPAGIRVRADLARGTNSKALTPTLSSYRLRFSYSE